MKINSLIKVVFIIIALFPNSIFAQKADLSQVINKIASKNNATVGVAIYDFETKKSYGLNTKKRFPMQSVFKFHIGLAVLDWVDKGKFHLDQKIFISKKRMEADWYSPIRDKFPNGDIYLSILDILRPTVSESDNVGCEVLIDLLGGPKVVNDYIKNLGMKDVQIIHNETVMQASWEPQFDNYSTPQSAVDLLKAFYQNKILSDGNRNLMRNLLEETSTGKNRIRGLLPPSTLVAHKTGTSGTQKSTGIMAAVNDIGVVSLPNGKQFAIAVFVSNSKENIETNEKIIAEIAKAAYDFLK
jgi:beta-lactamase class A